ncbi:MAG: segregation and condensation protein A [Planctomycetota bacterium]|jgi:segregation and condensation protein A
METEYKIDLESYTGPLDLLLYLIRRDEVDVYDIPIAKITDQYVAYLDKLQKVDIGLAGDFLVMAATLMYIKSRTLLPRTEIIDNDFEEDPRLELVKQLLEYKRYKETTTAITKRAEEKSKRYPRPKERLINEEESEQVNLDEIDVWKVAQLFSTFMKQTLGDMGTTITYDNVPTETYMNMVTNRLVNAYTASFNELSLNTKGEIEIVGLFLALLELVRLKKIKIEQHEEFGEILILSNN